MSKAFARVSGFVDGISEDTHPLDLELESKWQSIQRERDERVRAADIHSVRKTYLRVAFLFVSVHCAAVLALLFLCAFSLCWLPSAVLIAAATTMTANVIGVLYIAFKWLFPSTAYLGTPARPDGQ